MALEVGRTTAVLEGRFDTDAFDRYDRRLEKTKAAAKDPIAQRVTGDVDTRDLDRYDRRVDEAKRDSRNPIRRLFGAKVEEAGFDAVERRGDGLERASRNPIRRIFGARVDDASFREYDRKVDSAERQAANPIEQRAGLKVDDRSFDSYRRHADDADHATGRLRVGMGGMGGASLGLVTKLSGAGLAIGALASGVATLTKGYTEHLRVSRQTEAVIRSTGGAANVSADDVGKLSDALERKTTIDGDVIQSGANMLLTFTNVRNEVGRGNDIFNQAVATANDMSAALGTDAAQSAVGLGKALNDPVKGVTALQKVGVTFTAQQKDQIATLVRSGKTLDAQKIILRELGKEFGGSAEAAATPTQRLVVRLRALGDAVGEKVLPFVDRGAAALTRLIDGMGGADGATSKFMGAIRPVGTFLGGIATKAVAVGKAVGGFLSDTAKRNASTLSGIVSNLRQGFNLLTSTAGKVVGAIRSVFSAKTGGSSITRDLQSIITVALKVYKAFQDVALFIAKRAVPGIVQAVSGMAQVIRGIVSVIAGILTLNFGKAWDGVKDIFGGAVKGLVGILRAATGPFRSGFSGLFRGFTGIARGAWDAVTGIVKKGLDFMLGGVSTVEGAIAKALDAAGHLPFIGGKFKGLADKVRDSQKAIDGYRESLRDTDRQQSKTGKSTDALREDVERWRKKLATTKKGTDEYNDAAAALKRAQDRASKAMADARPNADRGRRGVGFLSDALGNAGKVAMNAAESITKNMGAVAKGSGAKVPSISLKPFVTAGLGATASGSFATGGIPNPGSGGADDHLLVAPDGTPVAAMSGTEGILNTPQMAEADYALSVAHAVGATRYRGLDDLWGSGMRHYSGGGSLLDVPDHVRRFDGGGMMARAQALDARHFPYVWGGGHRQSHAYSLAEIAADGGADCSGSVSYVLGIPPRVSGDFTNWGSPGSGKVTVYANAGHVYMSLLGKFFGTSGANPGGGAGFFDGAPRPGFTVRHTNDDVGAGGAGGTQLGKTKIVGPPGLLTDTVQGAADHMTDDANKWLQAHVVDAFGGGGDAPEVAGRYNARQMAQLWTAHRGPGGEVAHTAGAIGMAESGGDPNQRNDLGATGLWQIYNGRGTDPGLRDPSKNADAAVAKYRGAGNSFTPWTTYTGADTGPGGGPGPKTYLQYMQTGGLLKLAKGGRARKRKGGTQLAPDTEQRGRKILNAIWQGARGFYPGAGANEPRSLYNTKDAFVGMASDASGKRGGRVVDWPDWTLEALTGQSTENASANDMAEVAVHEWAHYFQAPKVTTSPGSTYSEGGAQSFTRRFGDAIFGRAGLPFKVQGRGTDTYDPYVRYVDSHLGDQWVVRDQFDDAAQGRYRYPKTKVKGPYGFAGGGLLGDRGPFRGQATGQPGGPQVTGGGRPLGQMVPVPPLPSVQLAALPRWARGKKGHKKTPFKEATLNSVGLGGERFRAMRATQTDRVEAFDHLAELMDDDAKRYGLQERRNDLTEEVFVDEKTGAVNTKMVARRVEELNALERIKDRMVDRLKASRRTANRVRKTYRTILGRLGRALKAANRKGKNGKVSKARRAAAKGYRAQIADYKGRLEEWDGKAHQLGFDIDDAKLDRSVLGREEAEVAGTKATPPDVDTPDAPDDTGPDDGGTDDGASTDVSTDTPSGDTSSDAPTEAAPTAETIAEGVAAALSTYQSSAADLYSSFGANFLPAGQGGPIGFGDAGVRYFGGQNSGADGGAVAGTGGVSQATEQAPGAAASGVTQNLYFTGPQPADPHVFTATALHELNALTP